MENQQAPNAGHIITVSEKEIHGMIDTGQRMVDFINAKLPDLEKMDLNLDTSVGEIRTQMLEMKGTIENLDKKLRALDKITDREDKDWRGDTPFETRVKRAFGKVISDSYRCFRSNRYRDIPEEYRPNGPQKVTRTADQYEESDALGGITVPVLTHDQVAYFMREKSLARLLCNVFPMPTDKVDLPALEGGTPTVYFVANGAAPSNSAITFITDKQLQARTAMSVNIVEGELIEDTALNSYSAFWAQVFMDQFALLENKSIFSMNPDEGAQAPFTGAVQAVADYTPTGGSKGDNVLSTSTNKFSSVTYDDLVGMQDALPQSARDEAVWVSNKAAWRWVRSIKDTTGLPFIASAYTGYPTPQPAPQLALPRPARILENDYYTTEAMPSDVGTAGKAFLIFGNFKRGWYFGDRKQMAIQWSSEAAFTSGCLVMRCRERFASLGVLMSGFVTLGSKA